MGAARRWLHDVVKPVIALVGRANVGKSTLFNRITKSRDAIVADYAGLTRDRHYGDAKLGPREFIVVDTGGFEPEKPSGVVAEMAKQTKQAVAEADAVIFVVDVRGGLSAQDHDIAHYLRSQRKKVVLAANKAEGMVDSPLLGEFHELGIGDPHPISSAHGQGIRSLIEAALEAFAHDEEAEPEPDPDAPIRLAVAGRPNVGKSTLINAWLGEERLVSFDQPGTTRDAIHVPFERDGQRFELIDTAGLRRKGRVFEAIACSVFTTENFSIASKTLPLRRRPAVSISSNFCPARSNGTWIASRVVPGRSNAIRRSSPSQVLISVLLPTLGRPATARRIGALGSGSGGSASSSWGNASSAASTRLRMPCPCADEMGCGSPMPSSWNSPSSGDSTMPSALLAASTTFLRCVRR